MNVTLIATQYMPRQTGELCGRVGASERNNRACATTLITYVGMTAVESLKIDFSFFSWFVWIVACCLSQEASALNTEIALW
jgi:hypothetical protein